MTCIVGLVDSGRIYIGADSAGVAGWNLAIRADPKIFSVGEMLIGFTSSFRMGQLLRFRLVPPPYDGNIDPFAYMATDFVDAIRDCLKTGGFARKEAEQESGGFFLVGWRSRLFQIESDYQVGESAHGFDAIGAGAQVAIGALYATQGLGAKKRVKLALKAAEEFNAAVRRPFNILTGAWQRNFPK